jgi:hypothetical protein
MHSRIGIKTKEKFKRAIKDVIKGLSRKVQINKQPVRHECDNCYFDKFTSKSTGKCKWTIEEAEAMQIDYAIDNPGQIHYKWFRTGRCPICKGEGFLETKRKVWINCLVTWGVGSNDAVYTPAGTEGATIVQLKTDIKYLDLFNNCISIVVDGIECKMDRPPICRGLGQQDILVITAFTTQKSKVNSGEIIKEYQ